MLDKGAVEQFCEVFALKLQDYKYSRDETRRVYRASGVGLRAGMVLNTLLPHMQGTEKHEQVICAFLDADWRRQGTVWVPPIGRKSAAMTGNKHSEETRKKMSESAKRRWARQEVAGR